MIADHRSGKPIMRPKKMGGDEHIDRHTNKSSSACHKFSSPSELLSKKASQAFGQRH